MKFKTLLPILVLSSTTASIGALTMGELAAEANARAAVVAETTSASQVSKQEAESLILEAQEAGRSVTSPMPNDPEYLKFKDGLTTTELDGIQYYVVEADVLKDETQLFDYYQESKRSSMPVLTDNSYLVADSVNGKIVRWAPGLILTYSIDQASFPPNEFDIVEKFMQVATTDWEDICGIQFQYLRKSKAESGQGNQPLFTVRRAPRQSGSVIASAFFPLDPPQRRNVWIFPAFFTTRFSQAGVLRHELGHVLGLRHEHIRDAAPGVCPRENVANTVNLGDYDSKSVMHYLCGGMGNPELDFTEKDRLGIQKIYGPRLSQFADVGK